MIRNIYFIATFQLLSLIAILFTASPSMAQKEVGIAAIVNDSAISTLDLQERIKIAMFASNLPKGQGIEEKILPQILRNLVGERIYMKEAEHLGIEVTKEEIAMVVADIEKRNGIQPGKFNDYLQANNISQTSMMDQIRSQLTWNKVIARKVRSQIVVTDKEIDEKIEHMSKNASDEESNISEILITVDAAKDDKKVKDIANKLVAQLRKNGNFAKVAKEFSKASSAEKGGAIGWIKTDQISDEISTEIKKLKTGDISEPIKVDSGYTILKVNKRRNSPPASAVPDAEFKTKIREGLMMKKLEIQANRYIRDLRRGSFIEVRI